MDRSPCCASCKAPAHPDADFCVQCGARLEDPIPEPGDGVSKPEPALTVASSPSASVREPRARLHPTAWVGWALAVVLGASLAYHVMGGAWKRHGEEPSKGPGRLQAETDNPNAQRPDAARPTPVTAEQQKKIDQAWDEMFRETGSVSKKVDGPGISASQDVYKYSEFEAWSRFLPGTSLTQELVGGGGQKLVMTTTLKSKDRDSLKLSTKTRMSSMEVPAADREVRREETVNSACSKCGKTLESRRVGKGKVRIGNREVEVALVTFSHPNCAGNAVSGGMLVSDEVPGGVVRMDRSDEKGNTTIICTAFFTPGKTFRNDRVGGVLTFSVPEGFDINSHDIGPVIAEIIPKDQPRTLLGQVEYRTAYTQTVDASADDYLGIARMNRTQVFEIERVKRPSEYGEVLLQRIKYQNPEESHYNFHVILFIQRLKESLQLHFWIKEGPDEAVRSRQIEDIISTVRYTPPPGWTVEAPHGPLKPEKSINSPVEVEAMQKVLDNILRGKAGDNLRDD